MEVHEGGREVGQAGTKVNPTSPSSFVHDCYTVLACLLYGLPLYSEAIVTNTKYYKSLSP